MMIEAGALGAADVLFLSPSSQRDEPHALASPRPDAARDFIAVHERHPDVEQNDFGIELVDRSPTLPDRCAPYAPSHAASSEAGRACHRHRDCHRRPVSRQSGNDPRHSARPRHGLPIEDERQAHFERRCRAAALRFARRREPPCMRHRLRTSVNPMPRPPCVAAVERSTCVNMSNTARDASGGMPIPSSRTLTTASPSSRRYVDARYDRRRSVYFAALLSRFANTCVRRDRIAVDDERLARRASNSQLVPPALEQRPAASRSPA